MIDPLTHTQAPIIIRTHTHILAVAKALTDGLEIRDEVEDRVGLVVHKKKADYHRRVSNPDVDLTRASTTSSITRLALTTFDAFFGVTPSL